MTDEITGSTIPGFLDEEDNDKWGNHDIRLDPLDHSKTYLNDDPEVISKDADDSPEAIEPYENDDPEVYGIAFPKTMLPLRPDTDRQLMYGRWEAEEFVDLEGGTDEVFVRVWLYGPTGQKGK